MPGPKVSTKMKKGVALCEEILGIQCGGTDFNAVQAFLSENLPKIKDKDIREFRKPSDKQLNAIAKMQTMTGDVYTGVTEKDASDYIAKHYDECFGGYKKGKKKK